MLSLSEKNPQNPNPPLKLILSFVDIATAFIMFMQYVYKHTTSNFQIVL